MTARWPTTYACKCGGTLWATTNYANLVCDRCGARAEPPEKAASPWHGGRAPDDHRRAA
jgi:hypothetical protein